MGKITSYPRKEPRKFVNKHGKRRMDGARKREKLEVDEKCTQVSRFWGISQLHAFFKLLNLVGLNFFSTQLEIFTTTEPNLNPKVQKKSMLAPMKKKSSKEPISIVGSEYCASHKLDFCLRRKSMNIKEYLLNVTDTQGEMNWDIEMYDPGRIIRNNFVVFDNKDGDDKVIMTLQDEKQFLRPRWKVFKGDSTDAKDVLYTVRLSRFFSKYDLDVYLPSNKEEEVGGESDFQLVTNLKDDWTLKGAGDRVLAQGYHIYQEDAKQGDIYDLIVSENVDYAFVISLATIFDEINTGGAFTHLSRSGALDSDSDSD